MRNLHSTLLQGFACHLWVVTDFFSFYPFSSILSSFKCAPISSVFEYIVGLRIFCSCTLYFIPANKVNTATRKMYTLFYIPARSKSNMFCNFKTFLLAEFTKHVSKQCFFYLTCSALKSHLNKLRILHFLFLIEAL